MRHPLAGPVEVSLAEFVQGLGPSEQEAARTALADNLGVARYGGTVVTYGDRRAHLPGLPPAELGHTPLMAIVTPAAPDGDAAPKSPARRWQEDHEPWISTPRRVGAHSQSPTVTETPDVRIGSARTGPEPRAVHPGVSSLTMREPEQQRHESTPELDWYRRAFR